MPDKVKLSETNLYQWLKAKADGGPHVNQTWALNDLTDDDDELTPTGLALLARCGEAGRTITSIASTGEAGIIEWGAVRIDWLPKRPMMWYVEARSGTDADDLEAFGLACFAAAEELRERER